LTNSVKSTSKFKNSGSIIEPEIIDFNVHLCLKHTSKRLSCWRISLNRQPDYIKWDRSDKVSRRKLNSIGIYRRCHAKIENKLRVWACFKAQTERFSHCLACWIIKTCVCVRFWCFWTKSKKLGYEGVDPSKKSSSFSSSFFCRKWKQWCFFLGSKSVRDR